jgi:hypothetical protein
MISAVQNGAMHQRAAFPNTLTEANASPATTAGSGLRFTRGPEPDRAA